jgi:hypothetical protein
MQVQEQVDFLYTLHLKEKKVISLDSSNNMLNIIKSKQNEVTS